MHIAVDALYIKGAAEEPYILALLQQLIQSQPEHHFSIITSVKALLPAYAHMTEVVTDAPKNTVWAQRRYSKTLSKLLREIKADIFISINSGTVTYPIPQLVFLSSPHAAERTFARSFILLLYKKRLVRQIQKADAILTFTPQQQLLIAKRLHVQANQVTALGYAIPPAFGPVSWQQKEAFLQEHTQGNEYFLYTGSFAPDTFLLVLKAFSLFKKRQLSNMQLIAAGHFTTGTDLTEKLATYKYRADVQLYPNVAEPTLAALTGAAYAAIWLDAKGVTAFAAAAAVQCQVPVIGLEDNEPLQQVAAEAGMYAAPTPESLAEQMKLVYKDENLRRQLVANAALQLPLVNGTVSTQKFWDCLLMAASKNRLHLPPEKEPAL